MNRIPDVTVVILSASPWQGVVARPHHFALGLARRGWSVLFVDPAITWLSPLRRRELVARLRPAHPLEDVTAQNVPGRLRVLIPPAWLPFGNMRRMINRLNQRSLARAIRRAEPGALALWSMVPTAADLLTPLRPRAVVYDCVDLHSQFHGLIRPDVVDAMERDLARRSAAVFATAEPLKARLTDVHGDVRLLPNAADVEHFRTAFHATPHEELRAIPEPRIGFIGGLGTWIDQAWMIGLARRLPDVQMVVIGPAETDVSQLAAEPNIHVLGRRPYADLPRYLAGFRATLSPFRVDDPVAQSVNPIKVYESIAAGVEVVATPIPELQRMADAVWLAGDVDAAVAAVRRILAGERRLSDDERAAFAARHSWDARVDEVDRTLRRLLSPGTGPQ
ncbi:MAG: glycosyltransferase [Thermoflavifilum sp.]|nr:glycosyltransferase [Thermoflavifilum sp.]MCL6513875.1 glycosyltransferase [Alicyclobacillus sp.]